MRIYNGMPADQVPVVTSWVKSQSSVSGNCVELAEMADGMGIAMRHSRDPEGPALIYTRPEIDAFIKGVEAGDFDAILQR